MKRAEHSTQACNSRAEEEGPIRITGDDWIPAQLVKFQAQGSERGPVSKE